MSRIIDHYLLFSVLCFCCTGADIPTFVIKYAPLVYLDVNDYYSPSDIGSQLIHTQPELNFTAVKSDLSTPSLLNLSSLNKIGNCNVEDFDGCNIFLTGRGDIPSYPSWLNGTLPSSRTGETNGARSCAVIVVDHDDGVVDAFYMYFYAFNLGYDLGGLILGNHVGDWEHTMVRFQNGKPQTVWYSQHSSGAVYTYEALRKKHSRPLVFSALGTHANYPLPGKHSRQVSSVTIDDLTSVGPFWDPILSAYFYSYTPISDVNGTFKPLTSSNMDIHIDHSTPVDWLYFLGRWGDKQYPDSNPAQLDIENMVWTWEDGPTGPLDKQLNRSGTCPNTENPCITSTSLPSISGDPTPSKTISRGYSSPTSPSNVRNDQAKSNGSSRKVMNWSLIALITPGILVAFV